MIDSYRRQIQVTDEITGEVIDYAEVKYGDRLSTLEQRQAYIDSQKEKQLRRSDERNFMFMVYEQCKKYLEQEEIDTKDVSRIIVLGTYVNYEGILMLTERTPMTKADMKRIIRESNSGRFNTFLKRFIELGIININENNTFSMSRSYFIKGTIGKLSTGEHYTRVYIDIIRELFQEVSSSDIKKLGYLFQVIPYLSYEHNILCKNPEEVDISRVEAMSIMELGVVLGLSDSAIGKLVANLRTIKLKDGTSVVGQFLDDKDRRKAKLIINPDVIYRGENNSEGLRVIRALFGTVK